MSKYVKVMTPKFRVSFPAVFKPKRNQLSQKDEYNVVALFEKGTNLKPLVDAVETVMIEKWGADKKKWPKNIRSPFRDQGEKRKEDTGTLPNGYVEGAVFINLKSVQKPGLINENKDDIIDESEFYAGCYAIATVTAYAYSQAGNHGVSFGLNNVMKVGEGESLTSRMKAQDEFSKVELPPVTGAATTDSLFNNLV